MNISHSPGAMRQRRADWLRNASQRATATQPDDSGFMFALFVAALGAALFLFSYCIFA